MPPLDHVANRLLKLELQLRAYQKLHEDELAELWKALDECKQKIAASGDEADGGLVQFDAETVRVESVEEDDGGRKEAI